VIVLMEEPFTYHDYRRVGESPIYRYVERPTP
jgi:hypothetical protein